MISYSAAVYPVVFCSLYSFVVPNLEIADLFAKVLVELQLNDESIRVIVLDNYNYKRAEESTAGPPGATPLEDYVALDVSTRAVFKSSN